MNGERGIVQERLLVESDIIKWGFKFPRQEAAELLELVKKAQHLAELAAYRAGMADGVKLAQSMDNPYQNSNDIG